MDRALTNGAPRPAARSSRRLPRWKTCADTPSLSHRWCTGSRSSSPGRRRSWGPPNEPGTRAGRTQALPGKRHRPRLLNIASKVPGPRLGNKREGRPGDFRLIGWRNVRRSGWNEGLERRSALNRASRRPMPSAPRPHKALLPEGRRARARGRRHFRAHRAAPDRPAVTKMGAANRSPPSVFLSGLSAFKPRNRH